jgi:apolipoprotein N-acyltransferase
MRLPASDWSLIALGAVLLSLAYAPLATVVPAFVCLVPASLLILEGADDAKAWRRHLHQGFWYGTVTHGALLYWLALAMWEYGRSTIALYLVVAVMFGGATAVVFALVGRAMGDAPGRLTLALPAGVVFLEWLAGQVGPLGFPWHQLGLTLTGTPVLVQAADLVGTGGLAFILGVINVSLALALSRRSQPRLAWRHAEVAGIALFALTIYGLHRMTTLPLEAGASVAVVQPNATAADKWTADGRETLIHRTIRLTKLALGESEAELVAWPETALPDALRLHPGWATRVSRLARESGSTILTGAVELESEPGGGHRRYNAALPFGPMTGSAPPVAHRKQKLIPMVERAAAATPDLSRTGFGGFQPGRHLRATDGPVGRYGTLLCYELAFDAMARVLRRDGAEALITLSNDAWLGRTVAPHQHFAHAVLRAVENRVTVIRAANTGVSGIVDPLGRVVVKTEPFAETYATGRIYKTDTVPLAASIAGMMGPMALGLLLVLLAAPGMGRVPAITRGRA